MLEKIKERRDQLEKTRVELKNHFIGIDTEIDRIIQLIEAWYIFPEIITKPVIINLWGLTGVGKTDLIRRLVKGLHYYGKYIEIQLDTDSRVSSVKDTLLASSIEEGEPGILLLDEIQRFKTKDERGMDLRNLAWQDTWGLLSDGKLYNSESAQAQVLSMWADYAFDTEQDKYYESIEENENEDKPKKPTYVPKYSMGLYEARRLRRILKISEPIEEIMAWNQEKKLNILKSKIDDNTLSSEYDYTKMLIFICGNLDEAFTISNDSNNADTDADIYHSYSKTVNIVKIKKALQQRFKPEQIARFGNNHVIYPSLSRKAYVGIIEKTINDIITQVLQKTGVKINVDQSIHQIIYENGVYPVQGVRPTFSTITAVFEAQLPTFLMAALENNISEFSIRYDNKRLHATINNTEVQSLSDIHLDLSILKDSINTHKKALYAVHEAGHALVYALLNGIAPLEVKVNITNFEGAYTLAGLSFDDHDKLRKGVMVDFAGTIAEELIFTEAHKTTGCQADIERATMTLTNLIRNCGNLKLLYKEQDGDGTFISPEKSEDTKIRDLAAKLHTETSILLQKHKELLIEISQKLYEKDSLTPEEFSAFFPNLKIIPENEVNIHEYLNDLYNGNPPKTSN